MDDIVRPYGVEYRWIGVDSRHNLGVFFSGERGVVPSHVVEGSRHRFQPLDTYLTEVAPRTGPATLTRSACVGTGRRRAMHWFTWWLFREEMRLARRGLFVFDAGGDRDDGDYVLVAVPRVPLRLEAISEDLRAGIQALDAEFGDGPTLAVRIGCVRT